VEIVDDCGVILGVSAELLVRVAALVLKIIGESSTRHPRTQHIAAD
jgi:hypothetical protein